MKSSSSKFRVNKVWLILDITPGKDIQYAVDMVRVQSSGCSRISSSIYDRQQTPHGGTHPRHIGAALVNLVTLL